MTTLNFPPVQEGDLFIEATGVASSVSVRFAGTADMRAHAPLESLLPALHAEVTRFEATEVVVDFRKLEFMNSSCFKVFLTWLAKVQELDAERRYKLKFLSNGTIHWQKRSLEALRCFATDLVTVEG